MKIRAPYILMLILLLASCKKKEEPEPEPEAPAPPPTASTLSGNVYQFDQFGRQLTTGLQGAKAEIEAQGKSASTNDKGRFGIPETGAGTYTLIFSKQGYSLSKSQIVFRVGDTISFNGEIAQKPGFTISAAYVKDTSWFNGTVPGIYYKAQTAEADSAACALAIVAKNSQLDVLNPTSYLNYAPASPIKKQDYNRFLSYTFLKDTYQFKKGDTAYVRIYPVAAKAAGYVDGKLNKPVYSAVGTAYPQIFKLKIP